ncbi:hypothetical protein GGX14DRAFT_395870 [Mycena pura]|uniref:Uncharacterized protein n=1 Tax=Mycena pura TaxID=153505 RepID=A0AAD6YA98_9AGAR|nr:hypothetical protein GGX14DRAFT_395870 [Mycena pura]
MPHLGIPIKPVRAAQQQLSGEQETGIVTRSVHLHPAAAAAKKADHRYSTATCLILICYFAMKDNYIFLAVFAVSSRLYHEANPCYFIQSELPGYHPKNGQSSTVVSEYNGTTPEYLSVGPTARLSTDTDQPRHPSVSSYVGCARLGFSPEGATREVKWSSVLCVRVHRILHGGVIVT